ncbi:MAG: response regulator [Halioglobus sp.]|nr:response regulator [Halioglobus sp.]MCB1709572.1 response regulator [Halioglobus sp.]
MADPSHILVVEDEPKIARLLADYLRPEGYEVSILNAGTGAVDFVRERGPDFIILDLMLPGVDGLTICREVRQFSDVPIMMLTARVDEIDRLLGLELGADDYVCKPFSCREVVSRVKIILRRVQARPAEARPAEADSNQLGYRNVIIYPERFLCEAGGRDIELTPVEFRMLHALISRPGHVFSRDRLMELSYPDRRIVSDRTIDTHIKNLRRKLHQALGEEELLHSIYGVGYKFE